MENRKPPSEQEVATWLQEGRVQLPPMQFQLAKRKPQFIQNNRVCIWDYELVGQWGDRKSRFIVEYKPNSTPKVFAEAVGRCLWAPPPPGKLPLLVMPYLKSTQLDELEKNGLSGIDLCGNGVVIIPDTLRIYRAGARNQFTTWAPIKNIYRKNTSMVARLFTTAPMFPTVRSICDEINLRNPYVQNGSRPPMGLGTVSKALKGMEQDLIIDRSEGVRLLQGEKLLSQLVDNYQPPTPNRTKRLKVLKTRLRFPIQIGNSLKGFQYPVVATGLSSVRKYAVMQIEERVTLYCPRIDTLQKRLKGTETDQFPNVEIIETDDETLFFDPRLENGLPFASPIQTYLELMTGDKRDQETAEQVKSLLLRTMKGGVPA